MIKSLGTLGDMGKMLKAAQEMQSRMAELQDELDSMTVTGESGAGLVKATATAKGSLTALEIDPSIFNPDEKDAQEKAASKGQDEMRKLTESLGLPAGMNLPF